MKLSQTKKYMQTQVHVGKKSKKNSSTKDSSQSKNDAAPQMQDNRSEAIQMQQLHELSNINSQSSGITQLQSIADNFASQNSVAQLQSIADNFTLEKEPLQRKENKTGLPDNLKAGMEGLSGMSLDSVNVHRNSDKPAQLNAHAYAQGTDIHLGSGQEKHLPHELGHVVQQAQGRVKPTTAVNGVGVNDNAGLEKEADTMGSKALSAGSNETAQLKSDTNVSALSGKPIAQRKKPGAGEIGSEKDGKGMKGIGEGGVEIAGIDDIFSENAEKKLSEGSVDFDENEKKSTVKESNDDGSVTTTEGSSKSFEGVGSAITKISEIDDTSIKEAAQYLAKAGAFGESAAKKTIESSDGTKASAEGKASGSVGAEAEVYSAVILDAVDGLTVIMNASAKAGYEVSLEGALSLAKEVGGVELAAKLSTKLSGFYGVMASVGGKFNKSWTGFSAEGKAEAMIGVEGKAEAKVELKAGDLGIQGGVAIEGFQGAKAGIEGKFGLGLDGIEAAGKLESFAGGKIKQSGSASVSVKGKTLFKISGELEESIGVGGTIEGTFELKNGKLVIGGKLAATLGIGGGAGLKIEVDFKEIGKALIGCIKDAIIWKWGNKEDPSKEIEDKDRKEPSGTVDQSNVKALIDKELETHVESYSKKKAELVTTKAMFFGEYKADNLVKADKLQSIIDRHIRNSKDKDIASSIKAKYAFVDAQIEETLKKNVGDMIKNPGDVKVNNLNIKNLGLHSVEDYRKKKNA